MVLTPLNLVIMFLLIMINEVSISRSFVLGFFISFLMGLITEMIGVQTGWLFGNYTYGNVMSVKLLEVPLMIGVNWFSVVFCSYTVVSKKLFGSGNPNIIAVLAALIATGFDWLMEPVAVQLGFWSWQNSAIPFYNYFCWFLITFLLVRVFIRIKVAATNPFAIYLLIIQTAFFLFLRFFL